MQKTLAVLAASLFVATAATAGSGPAFYDANEAFSPAELAMIKRAYEENSAVQLALNEEPIAIFDPNEGLSPAQIETIRAAFRDALRSDEGKTLEAGF